MLLIIIIIKKKQRYFCQQIGFSKERIGTNTRIPQQKGIKGSSINLKNLFLILKCGSAYSLFWEGITINLISNGLKIRLVLGGDLGRVGLLGLLVLPWLFITAAALHCFEPGGYLHR